MKILTIRTDKPEAEIGLFDGSERIDYFKWQAHRVLAETIHQKIRELLEQNNLTLGGIAGVVVFQGPGSFTGLRIGISVANATADSQGIPIVGETTEEWIVNGLQRLSDNKNDKIVIPEYGALPNITAQKK